MASGSRPSSSLPPPRCEPVPARSGHQKAPRVRRRLDRYLHQGGQRRARRHRTRRGQRALQGAGLRAEERTPKRSAPHGCPQEGGLRGFFTTCEPRLSVRSVDRVEDLQGLGLDVALAAKGPAARTGVLVIDLRKENTSNWMRSSGVVTELYDAVVLPAVVRPTSARSSPPRAATASEIPPSPLPLASLRGPLRS
jgi:hypothetical protein